jgi:hypothetical protein
VADEGRYAIPDDICARLTAQGWQTELRPPWTHVRPAKDSSVTELAQGWKLHVSATVLSAPEVLAACAPILVEARCQFKFAHSRAVLGELNDPRTPRGMSGKFITAYPTDDDMLLALAARLHEVTREMAGPRILSDARLHPDSLVHYRYGAFSGTQRLSNDGYLAEDTRYRRSCPGSVWHGGSLSGGSRASRCPCGRGGMWRPTWPRCWPRRTAPA